MGIPEIIAIITLFISITGLLGNRIIVSGLKYCQKRIASVRILDKYEPDAFQAGTDLVESAPQGSHYFAINTIMPWPDNIPSVELYKRANIHALERDVAITRIFIFSHLSPLCNSPEYISLFLNEMREQEKWHVENMKVLIYTGNENVIDLGLLVVNNKPQKGVVFEYDGIHKNTVIPGMSVENRDILENHWNLVNKIRNSRLIALKDFNTFIPQMAL